MPCPSISFTPIKTKKILSYDKNRKKKLITVLKRRTVWLKRPRRERALWQWCQNQDHSFAAEMIKAIIMAAMTGCRERGRKGGEKMEGGNNRSCCWDYHKTGWVTVVAAAASTINVGVRARSAFVARSLSIIFICCCLCNSSTFLFMFLRSIYACLSTEQRGYVMHYPQLKLKPGPLVASLQTWLRGESSPFVQRDECTDISVIPAEISAVSITSFHLFALRIVKSVDDVTTISGLFVRLHYTRGTAWC